MFICCEKNILFFVGLRLCDCGLQVDVDEKRLKPPNVDDGRFCVQSDSRDI